VLQPDWPRIEVESGLAVQSACFLGEGWNSRAYLVNDGFVFRFPKRHELWEELEREIKFLAFAADRLPLSVPRYVQVAPDSRSAAYGYAAYRYLRGRALNVSDLNESKRAEAAEDLGGFLRALHDLAPDPSLASTLPREEERVTSEQWFERSEREIASKLTGRDATVLRELFKTYLGAPENFSFQPVVLHADLSAEHILMDDSSIAAILDFGDVNWGDPDYDFMYLFVDFGQAFAEEVARRYGHRDIEQLRRKLRYFAIVDQIDTILNGPGVAPEGQPEAAWGKLRRILR
jgi:aminoglycoside 2''-phosphotransferase